MDRKSNCIKSQIEFQIGRYPKPSLFQSDNTPDDWLALDHATLSLGTAPETPMISLSSPRQSFSIDTSAPIKLGSIDFYNPARIPTDLLLTPAVTHTLFFSPNDRFTTNNTASCIIKYQLRDLLTYSRATKPMIFKIDLADKKYNLTLKLTSQAETPNIHDLQNTPLPDTWIKLDLVAIIKP